MKFCKKKEVEERGARKERLIELTVGDILRRNGIKELATNRYAKVCDVAQKLTSQTQTLVDLEGTIDIGVINKTFPSDGGARFLSEIVSG
jgi:hypothetical protein